jgi:hypothetical protein
MVTFVNFLPQKIDQYMLALLTLSSFYALYYNDRVRIQT